MKIEAKFNPVVTFREEGEKGLKDKLSQLTREELIAIVKAYTPDMNKTVYRQKNETKIIDYIIQRSSKLSTLGQCFRTVILED